MAWMDYSVMWTGMDGTAQRTLAWNAVDCFTTKDSLLHFIDRLQLHVDVCIASTCAATANHFSSGRKQKFDHDRQADS